MSPLSSSRKKNNGTTTILHYSSDYSNRRCQWGWMIDTTTTTITTTTTTTLFYLWRWFVRIHVVDECDWSFTKSHFRRKSTTIDTIRVNNITTAIIRIGVLDEGDDDVNDNNNDDDDYHWCLLLSSRPFEWYTICTYIFFLGGIDCHFIVVRIITIIRTNISTRQLLFIVFLLKKKKHHRKSFRWVYNLLSRLLTTVPCQKWYQEEEKLEWWNNNSYATTTPLPLKNFRMVYNLYNF